MRRSCNQQNTRLLQAYQNIQTGNLPCALQQYQSILQNTRDTKYRANIICTISVIATSMGNYQYALQILEDNLGYLSFQEVQQEQRNGDDNGEHGGVNKREETMGLVRLRYYANLCFLQVVMGLYEQAVETVRVIRGFIQSKRYRNDYMSFILMLFFRVNSLQDISNKFQPEQPNTLLQAYYMLNLAFAKDICNMQGSQQLLIAAYPIFISHRQLHLSVICLKQLLLLPLSNKEIQKYEKQLSKIISIGSMSVQNYEFDNCKQMQCCKNIASQILQMVTNSSFTKKQKPAITQNIPKSSSFLWKLVLIFQRNKVRNNTQVAQQQKQSIQNNIKLMLQQTNPMIMLEMQKTDFYVCSQRQIKYLLNCFVTLCEQLRNKNVREGFQCVKNMGEGGSKKSIVRNKSQNQFDRKNGEKGKENRMPLNLVRDRSAKSLINDKKQNIMANNMSTMIVQNNKQIPKNIAKMIKFCEYGSFLSKRNFNSDGGEYRFVRVTHSVLKWAKNPQKIQQSCQLYPLKDINSITYGKCSPTLLKQSNHLLKQEYCFSLRLQKRTLDFYCKDFEQACNWVCGLSYKLNQINPNVKKYTVGRMLWKRMFMILKDNFTSKIKLHDRKFYYENAYAVIMFGKNGCKLQKSGKK